MSGSWSPQILNRFLAPGVAEFTEATIPVLEVEGERVEHWMANHFLNSVFRCEYEGRNRQFAFNIIYRAQACYEAYEVAAAITAQFLAESSPGRPKSRLYYRALRTWENCFLNLQTFVDLINRATGRQIFTAADGSPAQRAYVIANAVKHWGQMIVRDEHEETDTVPLWLSNHGFHSRTASLTYLELAQLLRDAAEVVETLRDPSAHTDA